MKSSGQIQIKLKLLLDSTYLLPIIGIEVEDIEETLLTLISKLSRIRYDYDRVAAGLHAIEEGFKLTCQTVEGCLKALELKVSRLQGPHRPTPIHDSPNEEYTTPNERLYPNRVPERKRRNYRKHTARR